MANSTENSTADIQWSLNEIKNLIAYINKNKICEFKMQQGDLKIHIITQHQGPRKAAGVSPNPVPQMIPMMSTPIVPGMAQQIHHPAHFEPPRIGEKPPESEAPETSPMEEKKKDDNLVEIKSPMVGTFYRAPSPESPPYVQVWDKINLDSVLCIVEAMKLMNEIKAEMNGTVMDILVENGQPVEYGQPMFKIRPA